MPVIPMTIDNSTLVATSSVMGVMTFGFLAVIGVKPSISLVIGAIVGIALYSLGIVPVGFLVVVGFTIIVAIFKAIFGSGVLPRFRGRFG